MFEALRFETTTLVQKSYVGFSGALRTSDLATHDPGVVSYVQELEEEQKHKNKLKCMRMQVVVWLLSSSALLAEAGGSFSSGRTTRALEVCMCPSK